MAETSLAIYQGSPKTNTGKNARATSQGSVLKGVAASLVFQAIAFAVPITLLADLRIIDDYTRPLDRRQVIAWALVCLWGLTHWVLAAPMAWRWKRRSEARTVKGLYGMSIAAAIPSLLPLAYVLFLLVLQMELWLVK